MNLADIINPDLVVPGEVTKWGYRLATEDEYRAFPALNNTLLKCTTLHEMYRLLTAPAKQNQSQALALGTLLDMAILTPEQPWTERFAVADIPINPKTGRAYGLDSDKASVAFEAAQAANPGKFVCSLDSFEELRADLEACVRAFAANALCRSRLENSLKQVCGFMWHPTWNCWVKWKPDNLPLKADKEGWAIDDLKSTRHHVAHFEKDIREFDYRGQALWYAHCHETWMAKQGLRLRVSNFNFLVVSKPDMDGRQPRGAMARMVQVPLDPAVNADMEGPTRRLFPEDGFGIIERFLSALNEHLATNPDPADEAAINAIWQAYENESQPYILARAPRIGF